jgi:hypothetical protein
MSKTTVYTRLKTDEGLETHGQFVVGENSTNLGVENYPVTVTTNQNDYAGIIVQNLSTGDSNFTDIIASADNDTPGFVGHYADMGVTGSGFVGTSAALGVIKAAAVSVGGSGYKVGDVLTVSTGDDNALFEVRTLSGSAVATLLLLDPGTNYTTGVKATTGGSGTGCTINITSLVDYSVMVANDGYFFVSGGNNIIGTDDSVANKVIKFVTGGLATTNERMRITNDGVTVLPQRAPTAGGTTSFGLRIGSTTNFGIFYGSGVPTLSAAQGSLYLRTDGSSTSTRMYINTNGTTGWTNVTTAA